MTTRVFIASMSRGPTAPMLLRPRGTDEAPCRGICGFPRDVLRFAATRVTTSKEARAKIQQSTREGSMKSSRLTAFRILLSVAAVALAALTLVRAADLAGGM